MASGFESIGPGGFGFAITPSDSTYFALETRGIYVGTTGTLVVDMFDPATNRIGQVTFTAVPAGALLPIKTRRVLAASTATTVIGIA